MFGNTEDEIRIGDLDPRTSRAVRQILFRLASDQEEAAASEAALVPYWKPCPESVLGSRAAAQALRAAAESVALTYPPIGA